MQNSPFPENEKQLETKLMLKQIEQHQQILAVIKSQIDLDRTHRAQLDDLVEGLANITAQLDSIRDAIEEGGVRCDHVHHLGWQEFMLLAAVAGAVASYFGVKLW